MVLGTWQIVNEYQPANVTFPAIKHGSGTTSGALKKCPLLNENNGGKNGDTHADTTFPTETCLE